MENFDYSWKLIDGFKVPTAFSDENLLSCFNYKPKDGELILATYPRSGTNWTIQLIYLIHHRSEPAQNPTDFHRTSAFIDMHGEDVIKNMARPGVVCTHLPFQRVPYSASAKYINIARNPKDCFTSQYHMFFRAESNDPTKRTNLATFLDDFIQGNIPYESYFDHILSWYHHRNDPNVLFLTYEEMKKDLKAAVLKIATFMGEQYKEMVNDETVMNKIIAQSDVKSMSKLFDISNVKPEDGELPPGLGDFMEKLKFIRKGATKDWKNLLTKEQSERFDKVFQEKFKGTELLEIWGEYLN